MLNVITFNFLNFKVLNIKVFNVLNRINKYKSNQISYCFCYSIKAFIKSPSLSTFLNTLGLTICFTVKLFSKL